MHFGECRGAGCFKCGQLGHIKRDCPQPDVGTKPRIQNATCQLCGQYGHVAQDCRTRAAAGTETALPAPPAKKQATLPRVFVAGNNPGAKIIAGLVKVGGVVACTLFDTGATHNFVSQALTKRWTFLRKYEARTTRVETAGPDKTSTMGEYMAVDGELVGKVMPVNLMKLADTK
ncbi:hypothetical protein F2Q68_00004208 [Brassica cretica]|uniref:CCHC-type domain-containing protein n=1 Tax=Brassica cretica TaxID=69181 RepID=A0A8S9J8E7_BRACR|nr:hypothetical protein F2Q68_00004208 [Brassica cretica]